MTVMHKRDCLTWGSSAADLQGRLEVSFTDEPGVLYPAFVVAGSVNSSERATGGVVAGKVRSRALPAAAAAAALWQANAGSQATCSIPSTITQHVLKSSSNCMSSGLAVADPRSGTLSGPCRQSPLLHHHPSAGDSVPQNQCAGRSPGIQHSCQQQPCSPAAGQQRGQWQ
jgi:hypothetical protein